jgi:ketosteroid isomerase-like protein
MSRLTETIRHAYQSFAEDPDTLWDLVDEQVVFHVSGSHPLSGDYVGVAEVQRYLTAVCEATGGRGGFSVTSALGDDSGDMLLVEGTAFHGEGPFVRTVVHRLRLRDGRLVEFRDHPFDQQTEDRFWSARVPAQRDAGQVSAVIPAQPTSAHVTKR